MTILQYKDQVERAVQRYARGRENEIEDLRQEAWLALAETEITSPSHAYLVAKSRVRTYLEHRYGSLKRQRRVYHPGPVGGRVRKVNDAPLVQEVSTTEPAVFREAEDRTQITPDYAEAIDRSRLAGFVARLRDPAEKIIIALTFYGLNEPWTLAQVAAYLHITLSAAYRLRQRALRHLRKIMGVK